MFSRTRTLILVTGVLYPLGATAQNAPAAVPVDAAAAPIAIEIPTPAWSATNPPGSLWHEASTRELLGLEGGNRMLGDLITVEISEATKTRIAANTATKRESTTGAGIGALFGLGTSILNSNADMGSGIDLEASSGTEFNGDASTERSDSLVGTITCEVTEVMENGNLVIEGWKELRVNRETQYLYLSGMVRPRDIEIDNTIDSALVAKARIQLTGNGAVADKQTPGFGQRIVDQVWPF
jgi:flagellar L-ring protein precursor FlgH